MQTLRLYQIDAFTRQVFGGNPAAVCPLEEWPNADTLQAIAAENNLSETAFFAPEGDSFRLRWFTPRKEVSLCGHATLASAFVLFHEMGYRADVVQFETMSGRLSVRRDGDLVEMDFPAKRLEPCPERAEAVRDALHVKPAQVLAVVPGRSLVAVCEDEATVHSLRPDFGRLAELPGAVAVTAPGRDCDCVSRFFYPGGGIPEDPVTGSIHCSLVPYWSARLGKKNIHAGQASPRGGELFCENRGERVIIAGYAVKYMEGTITLPDA